MKKYIRAYKVKDGILIKEYRSYYIHSESELQDFCRQNGLKLKPQFYEYKEKEVLKEKTHLSQKDEIEKVPNKSKIISYYAD